MMKDEDTNKDVVKFSRLLYAYSLVYVIEFEVNGELKLWYSTSFYQYWENSITSILQLSDHCILQERKDLRYLFSNSPITHFDINLPNVENTRYMFESCKDLIYFRSKMPNVKHTKHMFLGCSELFFQNHPHLRDL